MHELSLCESLLTILEEQALAQSFNRVLRVHLDIGALSSVEPEAMQFCFSAVTAGTLADGASLSITVTPGQAWCQDCSAPVEVGNRIDLCPLCGSVRLQITGGESMILKDVEVL